ncbi:MAG: hypothetical protein JSV65_00325 [Armatimonadota bacterium]|nr:MAG: hypothetical protein JSV65_00325 [Armatimonadota bacterium]
MIKRQSGSKSFTDGLRAISPFLVLCVVYYVLAVLMKVSFKIWIPVALAAAIAEAVFVLGRLYTPFLVDKKGRCTGSRDRGTANDMEKCRHYSPGSRSGGCGHRQENGGCHLRRA